MLSANWSGDCEGRLASNCFDAYAWVNSGFIASSHTERRKGHSTIVQSTESTLLLESRFLYTQWYLTYTCYKIQRVIKVSFGINNLITQVNTYVNPAEIGTNQSRIPRDKTQEESIYCILANNSNHSRALWNYHFARVTVLLNFLLNSNHEWELFVTIVAWK